MLSINALVSTGGKGNQAVLFYSRSYEVSIYQKMVDGGEANGGRSEEVIFYENK